MTHKYLARNLPSHYMQETSIFATMFLHHARFLASAWSCSHVQIVEKENDKSRSLANIDLRLTQDIYNICIYNRSKFRLYL